MATNYRRRSSRSYDLAGNTRSRGDTLSWSYNANGRLAEVAGAVPAWSYRYNARGERVYKYSTAQVGASSLSSRFSFDQSGLLLSENREPSDPSNPFDPNALTPSHPPTPTWCEVFVCPPNQFCSCTDPLPPTDGVGIPGERVQLVPKHTDFIYLDNTLVAVATPKIHFVHTDHLGTPRNVIDPVRNVAVWEWPFLGNAFGESAANQNPDGDGAQFALGARFPGQYFDAESGLHYNYFRDYEPGTGRYVESDPTGLGGGISTFGYASNRPHSSFDRYGLTPEDVQYVMQQVLAAFPDVQPRNPIIVCSDNLPGGDDDDGYTSRWLGNIQIANRLCNKKCYTEAEYAYLLDTVMHEGMHSTDGWWVDLGYSGNDETPNHERIRRRATFEAYRVPRTVPPGPMWGSPAQMPLNDLLYQQFQRERGSGCCQ